MDFIISEQQLKFILEEQDRSKLSTYMKMLSSFTNDIVSQAKRKFDLNIRLLLTWGASVGGLVLPLKNYLDTGNFELNENQKILILVGVASILFYDNKTSVLKIKELIKKQKIQREFNQVLNKGKELRNSFLDFLGSLNFSVRNVGELLSYSFLIPIIQDLQEMAAGSADLNQTALKIAKRLIASGTVTISFEILTTLIKKILKRLG